ncbi:methyl-accepting chemotaxis protein [Texcoconibacillus texcoconensis]|uniref:Methyl-accepting chemotaxis protein n=1 Tax=Texcoconibacillus texcoconensis TaxID=1095777 RepID=A0A840QPZ5_9BACI|nr:methyl-accepting chemotaxis protein [Texcoconibacillus texcoconensis]
MKIKGKLLVSYAILIGVLAVIIFLTLYGTTTVQENVHELYEDRVVPLTELAEMNRLAENTRVQMVTSVLDEEEEPTYIAEENLKQINAIIDRYEGHLTRVDHQELFESFATSWGDFAVIVENNIQLVRNNEYDQAHSGLQDGGIPFNQASVALEELIVLNESISEEVYEDSRTMYESMFMFSSIAALLVVVAAIIYAFSQGQRLVRPLRALQTHTEKVAQGDLTTDPSHLTGRNDEIGDLARNFDDMMSNLHEMVSEVIQSSEQVAATSEQLMASAQESRAASDEMTNSIVTVSEGAQKQADTVEKTKQRSDQVSKGNKEILEQLENVKTSGRQANDISQQGNEMISETMEKMKEIDSKNENLAMVISQLTKQSSEIGDIINVITNIAEQTNLLALNAAIEASRAGEHGKGFAVVADEVRKLAEESSTSAAKIREKISTIQKDMEQAERSMDDSQEKSKQGRTSMQEADQAFRDILEAIQVVNKSVAETLRVSSAMTESTQAMNKDMDVIAKQSSEFTESAEQVAAGAEEQNASMDEITSASESLAKRAESLQQYTNRFTVK